MSRSIPDLCRPGRPDVSFMWPALVLRLFKLSRLAQCIASRSVGGAVRWWWWPRQLCCRNAAEMSLDALTFNWPPLLLLQWFSQSSCPLVTRS
uniref:Glucosamine 6-phosphate N-acetyltransferase n=1 Tax=Arundo donax TaxID=35708 RepID=A0A0A9CMC0_ARUDO